MIEKEKYKDILDISDIIEKEAEKVKEILENHQIEDLQDFISTVEGYSKYLKTTIELYQDADEVLKDLEAQAK